MNKIVRVLLILIAFSKVCSAQKVIFRSDDIGSTHAANLGVIESCMEGISRSAELMVVTPWLPEAVKMLNENPGIDVGIHLALTSEWENMKWRPLTACPSITDDNGYFLPNTFPADAYPGLSLMAHKEAINIDEVEKELRAQIELGLKLVSNVTHLSGHMMWGVVNEDISKLAKRLAKEYNLPFVDDSGETNKIFGMQGFPLNYGDITKSRESTLLEAIDSLEKGKIYVYIEHPAVACDEMNAIWHVGYENVSDDRQEVLDLYTSKKLKEALKIKGVELVSYGDIISGSNKK